MWLRFHQDEERINLTGFFLFEGDIIIICPSITVSAGAVTLLAFVISASPTQSYHKSDLIMSPTRLQYTLVGIHFGGEFFSLHATNELHVNIFWGDYIINTLC